MSESSTSGSKTQTTLTQNFPRWDEHHGFNDQYGDLRLEPGDMLVYRGREVPHWREQFEGRYQLQTIFHYVDANGPLSSYKYDARAGIGRGMAPKRQS